MMPRRWPLILSCGWLCVGGWLWAAEGLPQPLVLYQDSVADQALPYTPSGWMGDWNDLTFDGASTEQPHSGATCIKMTYTAAGAQHQGWAGIYWQRPANNWGDKDAGLDLTGAKALVLWARGAHGGEVIDKFQVGGIHGKFSDTCQAATSPMTLTTDWQEYRIPLAGKDLSSLIGAFVWVANQHANPRGLTLYLDDIRFE